MKIITIKTSVAVLAISLASNLSGVANAGVFDQLAAAANSMLPAYGRTYAMSNHPNLAKEQVDLAIREAMSLASDRVASKAAQQAVDDLRLSADLRNAQKLARKHGYQQEFTTFERQLGHAVAATTLVTSELVKSALNGVAIPEPRTLLIAHDTAATDYLQVRVNTMLQRRLYPVAAEMLKESGAMESGELIAAKIQFGDLLERLMVTHVVETTVDGFFRQLENEERAIRQNPEYRTTDLLRSVFR